MSINIKGATGKASQTSSGKSSKTGKGASSTVSTSAASADDRVEITEQSARLQQIEQSLAHIPVVNKAKVDSVTKDIENGEYQIDNEKVADKILEQEKALKGEK